MEIPGYDSTLRRFGLESLRGKVDLKLDEAGNIAVTRDGDLQMGDKQTNALFRMVERWRQSQPAINALFEAMLANESELEALKSAWVAKYGSSLFHDFPKFHQQNELIVSFQTNSSILAGSISVVLNTILQRFKADLEPSDKDWETASPLISGFSLGMIIAASANNFRHYDEWAKASKPSNQQAPSMKVLCKLLDLPFDEIQSKPSIRTNICHQVIRTISHGSLDYLNGNVFDFTKSLTQFKP